MSTDDPDKTPRPFALIEKDPDAETPVETGKLQNVDNLELLTILANVTVDAAAALEAHAAAAAFTAEMNVAYYATRETKTLAPKTFLRKLVERLLERAEDLRAHSKKAREEATKLEDNAEAIRALAI